MMTMMPPTILSIFLPLLFTIIFALVSIQSSKDREKLSVFECGFDPNSKARIPFSMRFFLLAVLFLIFDIEIMFILPIPILSSQCPANLYLMPSLMFIFIVTLGLLHEWNEGSLKWFV